MSRSSAGTVHGTRRQRTLSARAVAAPLLLGQAMITLDASIVQVAGPQLQRGLHLSDATLQAAVSLTVLVHAAFLIVGARLGSRYGYGRLFVGGGCLFTAASLACAVAVTPSMFLAARAMQGLGAAFLAPQVLTLLQLTFNGDRRSKALSAYALVLAAGVAVGQVLGGVLLTTDPFGAGWRSVFVIDVVLGLTVLTWSAGRLPRRADHPGRRLELRGAATLACAMLALVTPLTFGADAGWPGWSWLLLAIAVIVFLVFAAHESRLAQNGGDPLVDPRMLARPGFAQGLSGVFVLMACYGGMLFTTTVHLQATLHRTALSAGLSFAGFSVGFGAASLTWPLLPRRWHFWIPPAASIPVAAATACLAGITTREDWPWYATVLLALAGAGSGAAYGSQLAGTVDLADDEQAGAASGVLATTNQLGVVIGVAIFGGLYLSVGPAAMSWVFAAMAACHASTGVLDGWLRVRHRRRVSAALAGSIPTPSSREVPGGSEVLPIP
ncbi:MFS transporter [Kribbella sp. CA-253562]|uniref:MFS transporter n=1 Tax=Kribbella sp. CA-253562 TaxID=3239942 RepID=UPI003D916AF4